MQEINKTFSTLESEVTDYRSPNTELKTENQLLSGTIRELQDRLQKATGLNEDVTPLVGDQHAVPVRTLVDGVIFAAGWRGSGRMGDFMAANRRRIAQLFDNKFSHWDICDMIRLVMLLQSCCPKLSRPLIPLQENTRPRN
jgi:hypothetical protein